MVSRLGDLRPANDARTKGSRAYEARRRAAGSVRAPIARCLRDVLHRADPGLHNPRARSGTPRTANWLGGRTLLGVMQQPELGEVRRSSRETVSARSPDG
jgi:hypothetical protein